MKDYIGLKGHKYNIGELLSEKAIGAEGSVCEVIGEDDIVAKIYHKDVLLSEGVELENKLKLMIKKEIVEKHDVFSIAWPRDVLYENVNGESVFVGYTMRKITAKYTLSDLTHHNPDAAYSNPDGIKGFINWKGLIQAAYDLSSLIEYLHENGVEIGDFNERNFLFDDVSGGFSLIDCGAYGLFDTKNGNPLFPCRYTMPKYSAPEKILGINTKDPRYTDYFYLAIHIFHLLMRNSEPFGYKENLDGDPIARLHEHIANGDCIYVRYIPEKKFRKHSVKPGVLPDDILEAFNNTFNYTRETVAVRIDKRTTASEWCDVLEPYLSNSSRTIQCVKRKEHVYSAHLSECPWCNPDSVSDKPYELRNTISSSTSFGTVGLEGTQTIKPQVTEPLTNDDIDQKKVDRVISMLDSIEKEAYSNDLWKIKNALDAYDSLTDAEKPHVPWRKLINAEAEYVILKNNTKAEYEILKNNTKETAETDKSRKEAEKSKANNQRKQRFRAMYLKIAAAILIGFLSGAFLRLFLDNITSDTITSIETNISDEPLVDNNNKGSSTTSEIESSISEEDFLVNSIETLNNEMAQGKYRQMFFCNKVVYCLNNEGTIKVFAINQELEQDKKKEYSSWNGIKSISAYSDSARYASLIGLKDDGSVVVLDGASVFQGEIDVNGWNNIIQINASTGDHVLGLTADGTGFCTPSANHIDGSPLFSNGLDGLNGCIKFVEVQTQENIVLGLSSSGTVVSVSPSSLYLYSYYNGDWRRPFLDWSNLKDLSACTESTDLFGLTSDGRIVYGGEFGYSEGWHIGEDEVKTWTNITAISTGDKHIVALRSDGTVCAAGDNEYGQCDVNNWENIIRIEAYGRSTVGYGSDGSIHMAGYNCMENALSELRNNSKTN